MRCSCVPQSGESNRPPRGYPSGHVCGLAICSPVKIEARRGVCPLARLLFTYPIRGVRDHILPREIMRHVLHVRRDHGNLADEHFDVVAAVDSRIAGCCLLCRSHPKADRGQRRTERAMRPRTPLSSAPLLREMLQTTSMRMVKLERPSRVLEDGSA